MSPSIVASRKRPVNLSLDEMLVEQSRAYSSNLSATVEDLLTQFVQAQRLAKESHLQKAAACAAQWNAFHAEVGSFADQYIAL